MMLEKNLQLISEELPGFISVSIVHLAQGLPLVSASNLDGNPGADAFHASLYGMLHRGLDEMGADQKISSIVIGSQQLNFYSTQLGDTGYFIHLISEKSATLGFVNAVIRKYSPLLIEDILSLTTV